MRRQAVIVLDFFIVNVALPSIQTRLHASASAIEWVVAGYGLTFAVLLIAAGRLGDRYGRRRVFCVGLALFAVASALCGLAPTASVLVAARLVQGIGGALIAPNVLSIIGVAYPGPARVRAITVYGIVMGLAAATGQLIGGVLIAANLLGLGWRSVFLINVPVCLAALACAPRFVAESRSAQASSLDVRGMALVTAALTALVLPLVEGTQLHWPTWTWASLTLSPVLFALFALRAPPAVQGHVRGARDCARADVGSGGSKTEERVVAYHRDRSCVEIRHETRDCREREPTTGYVIRRCSAPRRAVGRACAGVAFT